MDTLNIRGREWKIQILSERSFDQKHGKKVLGITHVKEKILVFRPTTERKTIMHELIHAFLAESYLHSCNDLTRDDFEEIICETMSEFWEEIDTSTKLIEQHILSLTTNPKTDTVNKKEIEK